VAPNGKTRQRLYAVRKSGIHGRGVFAAAKIRRGTTILEYKGQRSSWKDALKRPDSDPNDPSHTFLFELDDKTVIDASIGGNAARWVNHSCAPNCETYEDDGGLIFIRARRRILPGEELTYDYCLTIPGKLSKRERARYTCHCLAATCRGSLVAKKKRRRRANRQKAY
jgi:SET domain-containing protein